MIKRLEPADAGAPLQSLRLIPSSLSPKLFGENRLWFTGPAVLAEALYRSQTVSDAGNLVEFDGEKYLNLETYRRNGKGVRTPVWFASAAMATGETQLYAYTTADSGKAKRIRRTGVVKIAPCDGRGRVTGQWLDAHAAIVTGDAFVEGMQLLDRKYWPWKRILDLSVVLFPRRRRVVIAIRKT